MRKTVACAIGSLGLRNQDHDSCPLGPSVQPGGDGRGEPAQVGQPLVLHVDAPALLLLQQGKELARGDTRTYSEPEQAFQAPGSDLRLAHLSVDTSCRRCRVLSAERHVTASFLVRARLVTTTRASQSSPDRPCLLVSGGSFKHRSRQSTSAGCLRA